MAGPSDAAPVHRDHRPPATGSGEKEVLTGFLGYLRGCVVDKLDAAPEPGVRAPGVPSGTNLLGLVHHLAHVERALFLGRNPRSWATTFRAPDDLTVEAVLDGYREAIAEADAVIAACEDLSTPVPRPAGSTDAPTLRWALTHMIEETARHAGHLDILREQLDGRTGR